MAGDIKTTKKCVADIFDSMEYAKKIVETGLAREWLNNHKKIDCWINGAFTRQKSAQYEILKTSEGITMAEIVDGSNLVDAAFESSVKARNKWEAAHALEKSQLLNKLSKELSSKSQLFSQLSDFIFQKNDFSLFTEYFNYYSDWALIIDEWKNWKPVGVVLVVLSDDSPLHALAMAVAPALATGCSVIVKPSTKVSLCTFLLAEIASQIGLPAGILNVIPGSEATLDALLTKKFSKVVLIGNDIKSSDLFQKQVSKSFSFVSPGHTSAIVLESCDLDSTVDKIFSETWNPCCHNDWSISTVVVQESISQPFLEKLKYRIKQFPGGTEISMKFRDKETLDKVNQTIIEAKNSGATVVSSFTSDEFWSPAAIVDYGNQDHRSGAPVLTVLTCRNVKEGALLVNTSRYCLATSVWTEISSQALEAAFMLQSGTVWVNCHGVTDAGVPVQPIRASGDGSFGGESGLTEFMDFKTEDPVENCSKTPKENGIVNKSAISKIIQSAQGAFGKWSLEKGRKKFLITAAESIASEKDLSHLSLIINHWAVRSDKLLISTEQNTRKELLAVQTKQPLGVIAVFINDVVDVVKTAASLISPAVALGNAVVLVTTEENASLIKPLVQIFLKSLPPNVLTVVNGSDVTRLLAADPNINAIWLSSESTLSSDYVQSIKQAASKHFKRLWVTPNCIPKCCELMARECLKNKVVWLTKVNQFP